MIRMIQATVVALLLSTSVSASAATLSGPITLTTGCCTTQRDTSITLDPNNTAVTITGWVDVSGLSVGSAVFVGLIDKQQYDMSGSTFMSGAYTYISRASATSLWVGPSDGNLGGEIVQEFDIPTNETLVNFTMVVYAGEITVDWSAGAQSGGPIVDDYGVVKTLNNGSGYAWDEFEYGAYLGMDVYMNSTPGTLDYSASTVPEPSLAMMMGLGIASLAAGARSRRTRRG